jgi:hypothetical protein
MGLYNNLVIYDQHKPQNSMGTIEPELATSWAWSADNKNLTFKLRQGVKWHDGEPFTAKDVKCTFDLLHGKSQDKFRKNPRKDLFKNISEVTTNGDYEVTLHLARPQPSSLTPQPFDHRRRRMHQREVVLDDLGDIGSQHLHGHRCAVRKFAEVHLRDGRAGDGRQVERLEYFRERPAEHPDDRRLDLVRRKWWDAVLQERQLVCDVGRQQIAPRRQHLPELDEDRTEILECTAQAYAARRREIAPEEDRSHDRTQRSDTRVPERKIVETVPERNHDDPEEPTQAHARIVRGASDAT